MQGRTLRAYQGDIEHARLAGYASALVDVSTVVAVGGGVGEILAFTEAKAKSNFSDKVRPEDYRVIGDGQ